jgi:hypothetical protein
LLSAAATMLRDASDCTADSQGKRAFGCEFHRRSSDGTILLQFVAAVPVRERMRAIENLNVMHRHSIGFYGFRIYTRVRPIRARVSLAPG